MTEPNVKTGTIKIPIVSCPVLVHITLLFIYYIINV